MIETAVKTSCRVNDPAFRSILITRSPTPTQAPSRFDLRGFP